MDIVSMLEKYSLTLRRLPDFETDSYFLPNNPTKMERDNCYLSVIRPISKEEFDDMIQRNFLSTHNSIFKKGYLIKKVVRIKKERASGWLVKICNNHSSIQQWSKKHDFYGETAEDAVKLAIDHIEKRRREMDALMKTLEIIENDYE